MKNPFILDVYPDLFVGYESQKKELLSAVESGEKYILIVGDIGVGKTTMVRWLVRNKGGKYIPRPTSISHLSKILKRSFISRIISHIFPGSSHLIVAIDEFHEASKEFIEELRSNMDFLTDISVVFVIIPPFEKVLKEEYPSLFSRITTKIYLDNLTKNEILQLIRQRIKKFNGGSSIEPFTTDAIEKIYDLSKGNPREALKLCSKYYKISKERGIDIIDKSFIQSYENEINLFSHKEREIGLANKHEIKPRVKENELIKFESDVKLTPKQREIITILKEKGPLSPPEIIEYIDMRDYASELHALRGINNILRRLESDGILGREKRGRRYVYYVRE